MKKIFLSVVTVMGLAITSQAQVKIGVKAGGSLSNQQSNAAAGTALVSKDAFKGYQAGLVGDVQLFNRVYLQPQVLYTQKGAKYTNSVGGTETKLTLRNIEMPLNILYKMETSFGKLIAGGGPVVSYGIGGKIQQGKQVKKLYSGDMKDWSRVDVGANAVAGVEFNNGIFTTVNYQLGLKDIHKGAADVKNRSVSLSVGYLIDWNKFKRKG